MPEKVAAGNMKQSVRMTQAMHKGPLRGQDPAGGPRGQCRGDVFPRGSSSSHPGSFGRDLRHQDKKIQPTDSAYPMRRDDSGNTLRYLKRIDSRTAHTDVQMSDVHKQPHNLNEGQCRTQVQVIK